MNDQKDFFLFWHTKCKANVTTEKYKLAASTSSPSNQYACLIVRAGATVVIKIIMTTSSFSSDMEKVEKMSHLFLWQRKAEQTANQ